MGGTGPICQSSMRPDAGRFIAYAIHTGQVLYGITGELKGEIESTNGAREWKTSIYSIVLSEPAMGFPNPSPAKREVEGDASLMSDMTCEVADEPAILERSF